MLNNYLGTKLTLMFTFIQYFVQSIKSFLLPTFVLQCMLWASTSSYAKQFDLNLTKGINVITIMLGLMIVGWTSIFISGW